MKKILFLLCSLLYCASVDAQITVSNSAPYNSAQYLVQNLFLGTGISASNITFSGNPDQMGFFNGINCNIGLDSGIILSTGGISGVLGPNDDFGQSAGFGGPGDPDLTTLTGDETYDAAILEFDFIPIGDTVRFRYVFASEEYPEYVFSYNDAFALFIGGPGITGQKNIALIPGTITPITINNVNNLVNSAYYVDNGDGYTPPSDTDPFYVQYDGFTVVLQAESVVQCGQTYHLKIAIADAIDDFYDSAVFLEAGSLAGNTVNVNVVPPNVVGGISGTDTALFEGCGPVILTFVRNGNLSQQATYNISYSGTALINSDYSYLPSTVTFPAGTDTVFLSFNPINDGVSESIETLVLQISNAGSCFSLTTSLSISDAPSLQLVSDSISVCAADSVLIGVQLLNGIPPFQYQWSTGDSDSAIYIDPSLLTDYFVTVTDGCGMQSNTATVSAVPGFNISTSASICPGDSIQLGGNWQNTDGIYYDSLLSINGCDSIIETILTINPVSAIQYQVSICSGDSIFLQGNYQTTPGTYYDTLASSIGCDSVLATTLTVIPIAPGSAGTAICNGDSIFLQGAFQTIAGIYYDTLSSALGGCDSIIATTLTINQSTYQLINQSICNGDSILLQGAFQTNAGIFYDTLFTVDGCNSVIATTLTINQSTNQLINQSICNGDSILLQGAFQTTAGIYNDTLSSYLGCDSVIITNLIIKPSPTVNAGNDTTIEEGATIQLNAQGGTTFIWSPSGELSCTQCPVPSVTPSQEVTTYYVTVTDSNGCSNMDSVNVFVEFISEFLIPNIITPNGDGLNDKFYFQGINVIEIEGKIFNRWGQLIFEWNGTDTFFEGKNMDGEAVPDGVYFFMIKAKDKKMNEYNREGTITVHR